eukprot:scaffold1955_cov254-Pinguiococcus_pyrenoidosus.AAC.5
MAPNSSILHTSRQNGPTLGAPGGCARIGRLVDGCQRELSCSSQRTRSLISFAVKFGSSPAAGQLQRTRTDTRAGLWSDLNFSLPGWVFWFR